MTGRRLSDDERVLWKGVTRSIAPLRKRLAGPAETMPRLRRRRPREVARPAGAPVAENRAENGRAAAVAPLTRKTKQRIARGAHAIDGRLDLHGMTQNEAHDALLSFLRRRQARGAKVVLVITGKGGGGEGGGRGVLKRMVPLWLGLPELRGLVIGFEAAGVGHGGEGALIREFAAPALTAFFFGETRGVTLAALWMPLRLHCDWALPRWPAYFSVSIAICTTSRPEYGRWVWWDLHRR